MMTCLEGRPFLTTTPRLAHGPHGPAVGLGGATLGRNTERSNPVENFDLSLFKVFRIGETTKIEYRIETFNAFNHPQPTGLPGADVTNTTAGRFLNYDFVSGGRRTARMGLKIIF